MDRLHKQLDERGWRASKSYKDFYHALSKLTGMRPKAMDMLNQTVAVKDIQSLTDFIRRHMLEANPWGEKVDSVLSHFSLLSEAHQSLVSCFAAKLRCSKPIVEHGTVYRQRAAELDQTQRLIEAADCFFDVELIRLFGPHCDLLQSQVTATEDQKNQLCCGDGRRAGGDPAAEERN